MKWKINSGSGQSAAVGLAGSVALSSAYAIAGAEEAKSYKFPPKLKFAVSKRNEENSFITNSDCESSINKTVFTLPVDSGWTVESQNRFDSLAQKEALGTISEAEYIELESLTKSRRTKLHARSGEEVIEAYQRSKHINQMVRALERYVEFEKRPRYSEQAT
ncbi:MAG: hypothetical protein AAGH72_06190 [Verrucomicrobiota bacterium]